MSEYKGTKGFTVQNYTTDPDNPLEGQVWYNQTAGALKYAQLTSGTWATGTLLNVPRGGGGGAGTQIVGLVECGFARRRVEKTEC